MGTQFAAHLTDLASHDEYMIVGNTAEEAEALGARHVEAEAKRGICLEVTLLGPMCGVSHPTGEVVKMNRVV